MIVSWIARFSPSDRPSFVYGFFRFELFRFRPPFARKSRTLENPFLASTTILLLLSLHLCIPFLRCPPGVTERVRALARFLGNSNNNEFEFRPATRLKLITSVVVVEIGFFFREISPLFRYASVDGRQFMDWTRTERPVVICYHFVARLLSLLFGSDFPPRQPTATITHIVGIIVPLNVLGKTHPTRFARHSPVRVSFSHIK